MTAPALRVVEANARFYRRTWRGSIISRFLSPLFFLLSMGLGLGALVDDSAGGAAAPGWEARNPVGTGFRVAGTAAA